MVRAGGREVMDAATVQIKPTQKDTLKVSYLNDAFVRDLPFSFGGRQRGLFGRYTHRESFGNFGLNALKYTNGPAGNSVGITGDFALTLIKNQVELYGVGGRVPGKRRLLYSGL